MCSRKAVGSLIGIGFLLMILALGFSYYNMISRVEDRTSDTLSLVSGLDSDAADEDLDIEGVKLTVGNSLNLTIKNTGTIFSELEWIGVFDNSLSTQNYYRVNTAINPLETRKNIGNTSIVLNPANSYTIQVLTKLGNIYYVEYPEPVTGGTGGGVESQFYYVDTSTDVNTPTELGTLTLFNAMKAGPDHVNSTLSEEQVSIPTSTITLVNAESFEGTWPPAGWSYTGTWNKEADVVYDGASSADIDGSGGGGQDGEVFSPVMDCSDATSITVDFYFYDDSLDNNEIRLYFWDGGGWDEMEDLGTYGAEDTWHNIVITTTNAQYFVNDFQILWDASSVDNNEHAYFDLVTITKDTGGTSYYDIDIEVSWSDLPTKTNEYLTIFAGIQGAENMQVDYWDGAWNSLTTDITPGFNVIDVSTALTGSSFTIRFTDTTGTGDAVQDSWDIDAVYLNLFD